ncbi:hypothetical protein A3F32_01310 [Candidatus Roizmanbacteria bacterium RIFCSPHIGHO2_12_FULL_42_10]|uniref:Carbohydrate kinase PfkB domain-containing protein n=1 Tax=Candidatus Roizmanbacteria bacterium RIFCSPHIGHO2_12_FULL_42_10 TaxID=1802053 RepID=A0A1F7I3N3_9BACT|nr:MAG: hypothetical protein A3F32_01310 [Candidatus Roizmanbacteria bacterium RIFCSPHIGHO2_12_FULL_42_10]
MYGLIAVGDITMDLYFRGDSLTQENGRFSLAIGGKYYSEIFYSGIGGSAANVSIHAAQLGFDTAPVATVGENSFKNIIVQSLVKKTVSTEFLHFEHEHMSIAAILLAHNGEKTSIKYTDPKEHIFVPEHALERIKKSRIIFMGNLSDVSIAERETFLRSVHSQDNLVALNFGAKDCEKGLSGLKKLIDNARILILNKYELCALIHKKPETVDLSKNHFSLVHTGLDVLVITDGKNGSYAYTANQVYEQPASPVEKVVDATGAGDAFTAAFLVRYAQDGQIEEALSAASQYAAKQLLDIGAN